jgi:hypothetical protein
MTGLHLCQTSLSCVFEAIKAYGPIERPLSEPVDQQQGARQSWLSHIRGLGRANAADLLNAWLDDFDAAGLTHEPSSFTALVQVLSLPSVNVMQAPFYYHRGL